MSSIDIEAQVGEDHVTFLYDAETDLFHVDMITASYPPMAFGLDVQENRYRVRIRGEMVEDSELVYKLFNLCQNIAFHMISVRQLFRVYYEYMETHIEWRLASLELF